jgi:hypothetical protein
MEAPLKTGFSDLPPDPGLLGKVNRRVTEEMNASLLAPFTADEVKAAL